MASPTQKLFDELPLGVKMLTAGTSGCIADFLTFPLDTAKVRLQIQGEYKAVIETAISSNGGAVLRTGAAELQYHGLFGTVLTIARKEGTRALYNGLSAGLQRQMCFASVRLGFYDSVKALYQPIFDGNRSGVNMGVATRVAAGLTTGAMAVLVAQPTDVVKIRFQAEVNAAKRYKSTFKAYQHIASSEGAFGLWRGILPNVARNAIINVAEIVVYDIVKDAIIKRQIMGDTVPCHFTSAVIAGFSATVVASPVDVIKTRYMNSTPGTYRGAIDCAVKTALQEGSKAFYKGFVPSFCRLVSWNIFMWLIYEQMKKAVVNARSKQQ